jgi:hypothetical protein
MEIAFQTFKSVKMYSLSSTESDSLYLIIVFTDKIRFEVLRRFKQSLKLCFKRNVLNLYFTRIPRVFHALPTREERVFICRLKILGDHVASCKNERFTLDFCFYF